MMPLDLADWDAVIAGLPGAHILQTAEWGQFKALYGWQPLPRVWRDAQGVVQAAALVLRRSAPGGLHMLYAPRGPLLDWSDAPLRKRVLADLQALARSQHAIAIKIDPELIVGFGVPGTETEQANPAGAAALADLQAAGWRFSGEPVQFRNTVWLDLAGDEADWLARMKQKARYNLRLAQRKGVQVREGGAEDLAMLYSLYAETSVRDGFLIREEGYYRALWQRMLAQGLAAPLIAEVEGQAVGAVFLFAFAGRAWYLYGMSREAHREKMPNYLLQWEAMRWAKARGCRTYDLWGAPDVFDESDAMWGVFRFKEGLGGQVVRTAGAWDYPASALLYGLYTRVLPRILAVMRRRGRAQTRAAIA